MGERITIIWKELREHMPFTALAALGATILTTLIVIFYRTQFIAISANLFEAFHPLHVIFSAFVTSSIFYKYKKNKIQAILVGVIGAILVGSLSDIILPWAEVKLIGLDTLFHLPIIETPLIIAGAALIGSLAGISTLQNTKISHLMHVFFSVFASLFYIIAFSESLTLLLLTATFFIVFIAVIVPCCLSDIIFPLLFIKKK